MNNSPYRGKTQISNFYEAYCTLCHWYWYDGIRNRISNHRSVSLIEAMKLHQSKPASINPLSVTVTQRNLEMRPPKTWITLITILTSLVVVHLVLVLLLSLTVSFPPVSSHIELHLDEHFQTTKTKASTTSTSNNKAATSYSNDQEGNDRTDRTVTSVSTITLMHTSSTPSSTSTPSNHTTHNIFFNIFLNAKTRITFFRSLKIVDEQLKQIPPNANGTNNTNIYFTLIGSERYYGNSGHDICHKYPGLHCTMLGDYRDGGEELTLQPLYEFCVQHPTDRVTYIHDKGSFRHSTGNTKNRRRATLGAVSDECHQMPLNGDYPCNICGTKFQSIPFLVYQANMWTAECSYIRQLVQPKEYVQKRKELLERLWEQNRECLSRPPDLAMADTPWAWNLSNPLFLRNVGLGRYALERWMLHHPSMIPCDLLPTTTTTTLRNLDINGTNKLTLGIPIELNTYVSLKAKARQSWMLQQEYAELYPNIPINDVLAKNQAKPIPRPCW